MNTYPENIENILGVDDIRNILLLNCENPVGKQFVRRMQVSSNSRQIELWLDQVEEFTKLISTGEAPVLFSYDLHSVLEKLKVNNQIPEVEEFLNIRFITVLTNQLTDFFTKHQEAYPQLYGLTSQIAIPDEIVTQIDFVFDDQGRWKRNASKKLHDLLAEIDQHERQAFSVLTKMYEKIQNSGWSADTGITVKEGRMVVPVLSEHKKKVQGIVHDESGGGKILYIEPLEVLDFTNRLKELEMERDREMRRILIKLTTLIQPYLSDLKNADRVMGVMDFIRSKARLALKLEAQRPEIVQNSLTDIRNMRHPLLLLHHSKKGKDVIPMDIKLTDEDRLMVVSGPNAGGKSVSIKTLALNQYLLQCGLLIPCEAKSKTQIFKKIFVDIGDSQSIENDLSSYSGHLTAMKYFLEKSNPATLIVIDEIGSGTDPNFGGAMAEAILISLNKKKVSGMVTTHFGNIKNLADRNKGMFNGSMAFDMDNLKPLYRLKAGIPGSSFALEVARNIGLDESLIKLARKRSNTVQQKTDELLARLETEKEKVQELTTSLETEKRHLEKIRKEYTEIKENISASKKDIVDDARKKALEIIKDANKLVENTIREIRENQADSKKTKKVRKEITISRDQLQKQLGIDPKLIAKKKKEQESEKPVIPLIVGTKVRIPNSQVNGEIVEIRKDKAVVVAGIVKSNYPLKDLKPATSEYHKPNVRINYDMIRAKADFVMEKDIRGLHGEEAIKEIDSWIDQAIIVGSPELRLIHGKGDGILKNLIRDYYRNSPYIKSIRYESLEFGGEGVSIIQLK